MRTTVLTVMFASLFSTAIFAQSRFTVSALTGYTMSAFEDQEDAAGTLPIGVLVGYKAAPNLEVGVELNHALGGFGFEFDYSGTKITTTFNQTIFGVFGKYHFTENILKPYAKLGVGYYTGNADVEYELNGDKQSSTGDIDSAIGFNLGAGLIQSAKGFFAEFNYHIVTRKVEGESGGMNSWAILIGYKFIR
jgi:opacity protein-like surface antigen